jgi:hypothetical protein
MASTLEPVLRADFSARDRHRRAAWPALLAVAGVAGVALRVWVYRSPSLGVPLSDEAVVGLMTRHLLHGEFPTFYWGQAYGGSQEVFLTAPLFWVAGPSWLVLRLVPMALSAVAAVIVWRVGLRTIGAPRALGAAALLWLWPPWMIWAVSHQLGFYGSDVLYGSLLLLLALRIVERPDAWRVGLFGLVLGMAFWQTSQIVPLAAGVIVWTVCRSPRSLRYLWAAVPLAILGALPWLVWNTSHGWASLHIPPGVDSTYLHRLRGFVSPVMPMILGLRAPPSQSLVLPKPITLLLLAAIVALFAYGAYRTRRTNTSLLYTIMVVFPFVWAISGRTAINPDPRYVVVLAPVLALLVGQLMGTPLRAALVIAVALVTTVVSLHHLEASRLSAAAPRNISPLLATLEKLHVSRVNAPYWAAYVIDFDSKERVIAVENSFNALTFDRGQAIPRYNSGARYLPYQSTVAQARHGFVFFRVSPPAGTILHQLESHGYARHTAGPFIIYAPRQG